MTDRSIFNCDTEIISNNKKEEVRVVKDGRKKWSIKNIEDLKNGSSDDWSSSNVCMKFILT